MDYKIKHLAKYCCKPANELEFEAVKQGDTIEFYISCNADRKLYTGKVEYKDQLGLICIVNGLQYELRKLVDIKVLNVC